MWWLSQFRVTVAMFQTISFLVEYTWEMLIFDVSLTTATVVLYALKLGFTLYIPAQMHAHTTLRRILSFCTPKGEMNVMHTALDKLVLEGRGNDVCL